METLKLLGEAKANGLSKEEFLHLMDLEVKMNESKNQKSGSYVTVAGDGSFEMLLVETCNRLENQQRLQHEKLQMNMKALLEQQKQDMQAQLQQFQHKMQQQHVLLQQQVQLQTVKRQINDFHKQDLHGDVAARNGDEAILDLKDRFHEMRTTVLNRLEEEKIFMRDALSKAQNDILSLLSKTGEDVSSVKEVLGMDICTRAENQIGLMVEGEVKTREKKQFAGQGEKTQASAQISEDLFRSFTQDLESKIEDKLQKAVGSLKKDLLEAKDSFAAAATVSDKEGIGEKLDKAVDSLKKDIQEVRESIAAASVSDKEGIGKKLDKAVDSLKKDIQNVRESIAATTVSDEESKKSAKCYSFDFHINGFNRVAKNEEVIESMPFYIDEFEATVKSNVQFVGGDMQVWLSGVYDPDCVVHRNSPLWNGVKVNVTTAIVDLAGKLPEVPIGEKSFRCDASFINNEQSMMIGNVRYASIAGGKYAMNERNSVLLRYSIRLDSK